MKFTRKYLPLLLTLVMVLSMLPSGAFAVEMDDPTQAYEEVNEDESSLEEDVIESDEPSEGETSTDGEEPTELTEGETDAPAIKENEADEAESPGVEPAHTEEGAAELTEIIREHDNKETVTEEAMGEAVASGTCGENVMWTLDSGGILTISGQGSVYENYWYNDELIISVVIEDGITAIEKNAFECCENLISVSIPNSLTSIGKSAFEHCESLDSVTIPDSVTTIGERAFAFCHGLNVVTLSNSVSVIKKETFRGCSSLTTLMMGNRVTQIEEDAFFSCSSLTSLTIPDSVINIGENAFGYCKGLTSIEFGNSVKNIEEYAFYNCCGLTSLTIPDSVTNIAKTAFDAFDYNNQLYMENVTIGNGITDLDWFTYGKGSYYHHNYTLTTVVIGDGITCIPEYMFAYCPNLTNVTIGNGVTDIGESAFENCAKLTSITIPESVTNICDYAFRCSGLTNVTLPDSLTYISDMVFLDCINLTSITIPESITSIGVGAFWGCSGLTGVTIPNSVTSVGSYAFCECTSLTSISLPDSIKCIDDCMFLECASLTSITIPDSVTSIGERAFSGCSCLTSVTISDSVTSIGDRAFWDCTSLTSITIPDSVTSIGNHAFYNCTSLTNITIPNSVTSIGEKVFSGCDELTTVMLGYNVKSILGGSLGCSITCAAIPPGITFNPFYEEPSIIYGVPGSWAHTYANSTYDKETGLYRITFIPYSWEEGELPIDQPTPEPPNVINIDLTLWKSYNESSNGFVGKITNLTNTYGSFFWDNHGSDYDKLFMKVSYTSKKELIDVPVTLQAPEGFSFSPYALEREKAITVAQMKRQRQWQCIEVYPICSTNYSDGETLTFAATVNPSGQPSASFQCSPATVINNATAGDITLRNSFHDKDVSQNLSYRLYADFDAFSVASSIYDNNLCKMCVALSAGAYRLNTVIDDLTNLGFSNIKVVNYKTTDDQVSLNQDQVAGAFATKKILVDGQVYTIVAVVLRGTVGEEWYSNFDMSPNDEYHRGFFNAKVYVLSQLRQYMEDLQSKGLDKAHTKMLITGHSRAAAVADLLTVDLNQNDLYAEQNNIYTYTFATPHSVRDVNVMKGVYIGNIYNICNVQDFVSHIPGQYISPGKTIYINNSGDKDYFLESWKFRKAFKNWIGKEYYGWGSSTTSMINKWDNWSISEFVGGKLGDSIAALMLNDYWKENQDNAQNLMIVIRKAAEYFRNNRIPIKAGASVVSLVLEIGSIINEQIWDNHAIETYIKWVDVIDDNLKLDERMEYCWKALAIVACPVDVTMYDENGALVAQIVNHEVVTANGPDCGVEGELKYFVLDKDSYRFEITGNDAGTMDVTVERYGDDLGISTRHVYRELPVNRGENSTLTLSGSSTILKDAAGTTIAPNFVLDGDEIDSLEVEVTITGDGNILGDGSYSAGDQVTLSAIPNDENVTFFGWYLDDDTLVSEESKYTFICTNNCSFTARFSGSASGGNSCGDNLTWTLNNGILTISGTGKMDDYLTFNGNYWVNTTPWKDEYNQITSVKIENGVTSIGAYAFAFLSNLTSASIPGSVTSISSHTFFGCGKLDNVTVPGSVTKIGDYAFSGCAALTGISIPGGVTEIGEGAFNECTGLSSVVIPNSVIDLGSGAFYGCTGLKSVVLSNRITCIYELTFMKCIGLTGITIPSGVTSIGARAFGDDSALTVVTLPASVTSIAKAAFSGCSCTLDCDAGSYALQFAKENNFHYTINGAEDISRASVSVSAQTYTGNALTPAPNVQLNGSTLNKDRDYKVTYKNNTKAGTATVIVTGIGNYTGTASVTFQIKKAAITPKVTMKGWIYGNKAQSPSVTGNTGKGKVTYSYAKKGTSSFSSTKPKLAGTYTVKAVIAATENYNAATATDDFTISKASQTVTVPRTSATIEMGKTVTITGKGHGAIKYVNSNPKIASVTSTGVVKGVIPGTVKITVKADGNDNYKAASRTVTIKVVCPKPVILNLTNTQRNKTTVKWKKISGISGYEIQYSTSNTFKSGVKKTTAKASAAAATLKNLTKGKTWYVRIRCYKKMNGKNVYSTWSTVKSLKVKK